MTPVEEYDLQVEQMRLDQEYRDWREAFMAVLGNSAIEAVMHAAQRDVSLTEWAAAVADAAVEKLRAKRLEYDKKKQGV